MTIRVHLARMPRMMREILQREIIGQPDLELVNDGRGPRRLAVPSPPPPDVVIVGSAASANGRSARAALLALWPHARIVVLTEVEGDAAIYELRLQRTLLGHVSANELVQAIRSAVG